MGRRRELSDLRADVERAGLDTLGGKPAARCRVLLIAGQPGSGRTALAEEFAASLGADYPDGVLRARLTDPGGGVVPVARVARDLLGALSAPVPAGACEDQLTEVLRAELRERRAILLLDDVAASEQLVEVLPETRHCLVLATAEGPLTGVPDVRPCALGGLDTAAALDLLAHCAGSEIRITVDPKAAEALCELCAHHPAALLLTGGWLAAHPQASVLEATKQLRARAHEPRALVRAFRLVYDALSSTQGRLLRLLPAAPDGFVDAQIASALAGCAVAPAAAMLEHFARLGLLRALGEGGYRVPGCLDPLLRELLTHQERPADVTLARARMWERVVRQLRACWAVTEPMGSVARKELAQEPRSIRFGSAAGARTWLDSRLPALLAAARLVVADGELDTLARRLIASLARALSAHHSWEETAPEQYRLHELVLSVAERRGLHRERAAALLNLGDLDAQGQRLQEALRRYRLALEAARLVGEGRDATEAAVRAMDSMACTYAELEDWDRAVDWYGRALALAQTSGDLAMCARLESRVGAVQLYAGRWAEALHAWRAAASGYRRLRDTRACAHALGEVARVQEYAGRPQEALRSCRDAVEWAVRAEDDRLVAALRLRLAEICERVGDHALGRTHRARAQAALAALSAQRGAGEEAPGQSFRERQTEEDRDTSRTNRVDY